MQKQNKIHFVCNEIILINLGWIKSRNNADSFVSQCLQILYMKSY